MSPGKRHLRRSGRSRRFLVLGTLVALLLAGWVLPSRAAELDEAFLRIEINATDGDVGFHGKFDGEASKEMKIRDPKGGLIYLLKADKSLRSQGLTESFFESDEPTCAEQPLRDFLSRFPSGAYSFQGKTTEGDKLEGEAVLSHALPAAPDISATDGADLSGGAVVISWAPGVDLGNCHDPSLVADGTIPDPAEVPVDSWEVVVEPDEDELAALGLPSRVFSVQLPPEQLTLTVPLEYLQAYVAAGVTTFKFEVGAKAGENQTFSEGTFIFTGP